MGGFWLPEVVFSGCWVGVLVVGSVFWVVGLVFWGCWVGVSGGGVGTPGS